ncbi:uncharacterized protein LOC110048297 [Orbicella faveolata]|uniref:uncharacterized protein LOC110048297 n=1 Tax=Orbicella faveolata TaxID=48498 RepID=UPI0009E2D0EF|nr:uncharacterized protein LOC110048297 [Orbicella faveolata]
MAPGKTHVKLKLKNKFQTRKRNSSGVRKAKNNSLPKKKLKEKTFQQIEEINKSFTAVHNTLLIEAKSPGVTDSKVKMTEQQSCDKINKEKLIPSNKDVTQEELSETVENIANL